MTKPHTGQWVLIKGWHDSGTIEAVYGPYSEAEARWLHQHFAADHMSNWTLAECQRFTAEPPSGDPAQPAPQRDPASTTATTTQVATPANTSGRRRETAPVRAFGFSQEGRS